MKPSINSSADCLERVIARIHAEGDPRTPVVVFDLDGTLYDNRTRTLRALAEYAEAVEESAPEVAVALSSLSREDVSYLLADTLHGCGIARGDLVQDITRFWRERFLSEAYLAHDETVAGAESYVRACHQAGATVVYFTGRDVSRLVGSTMDGLRDRGFPVGVAGVETLFNPDSSLSDEAFKRVAMRSLNRIGRVVAFFDNEPANCNLALSTFPDCIVGWVQTQRVPGAPELAEDAHPLRDFRRA